MDSPESVSFTFQYEGITERKIIFYFGAEIESKCWLNKKKNI
jgi:hypothetical protein